MKITGVRSIYFEFFAKTFMFFLPPFESGPKVKNIQISNGKKNTESSLKSLNIHTVKTIGNTGGRTNYKSGKPDS